MKCIICKIATILAGIGALNWLLVALLDYNLVSSILGVGTMLTKIVYILVGLSGIMLIVSVFMKCPKCPKS